MKTEIQRGYTFSVPPGFPLLDDNGLTASSAGGVWYIAVRIVMDGGANIPLSTFSLCDSTQAPVSTSVSVVVPVGDTFDESIIDGGFQTPAVLRFEVSKALIDTAAGAYALNSPPVMLHLQAADGTGSYYYTVVRVSNGELVSADDIYNLLYEPDIRLSRGENVPGPELAMSVSLNDIDGLDGLNRRLLYGQEDIQFPLLPSVVIRNYGMTTENIKYTVTASLSLNPGEKQTLDSHTMSAVTPGEIAKTTIHVYGTAVILEFWKSVGYPVLVCMVDASGSMGPSMAAVKAQLEVLDHLVGLASTSQVVKKARTGVALLRAGVRQKFGLNASQQLPMLGEYTGDLAHQQILKTALDVVTMGMGPPPDGYSPLGMLVQSGRELADASHISDIEVDRVLRPQDQAVLMLVTDGWENGNEPDEAQLSSGALVYTAGLGADEFASWLATKDTALYVFLRGDYPSWWNTWFTDPVHMKHLDIVNVDSGHPLTMFP